MIYNFELIIVSETRVSFGYAMISTRKRKVPMYGDAQYPNNESVYPATDDANVKNDMVE